MQALLAIAPILLVLGLMVGLRWPAAKAGLAGLAATAAIAFLAFDFGRRPGSGIGPWPALGGALAEALFVTATIAWIIFPALCIHEYQQRVGAFGVLRDTLARLTGDPRVIALLVAWFFALFLEGAAGFGTPVALAAPILVSFGFTPVAAVSLVMIGHAAGVSFGAVGTPVLPQVAATGLSGQDLARAVGLLHACLGWILLLFLFRLAGRDQQHSGSAPAWAALAALAFLLPYFVFAYLVGPELPTLGGALVGSFVFLVLLRWRAAGQGVRPAVSPRTLLQALLPYLVLITLILATRLVPPLAAALKAVEWSWSLPGGFAGSVQVLYHPGTLLLLGFLLGGALQPHRLRDLGPAALRAAGRLPLVLVALAAMLGMARLMVHGGLIAAAADAAATTFGGAWPWLSPMVGVLGTFVTGSATASNILMTDFQQLAAQRLDLPVLWLVAAQAFGAAVGNIICPHNIIAGGATVGLEGREGEVLRRTAVACLVYALAGGALVYALIAIT